jgi:hypothetical protein
MPQHARADRRRNRPAEAQEGVQKPSEGQDEPASFESLVDALAALLKLAGRRSLAELRR